MVHSFRLPAPDGIAGDRPTHDSTNWPTATSASHEDHRKKDASSRESSRNRDEYTSSKKEHEQEDQGDDGQHSGGRDEENANDTPKP